MQRDDQSPGYWQLVASGEPFRLLFPAGVALGVAGVMMWPFHVWKHTAVYPGQFHARVMIEGFLTAFVIGFLGTALPRLLDVPRLTLIESAGFACGVVFVGWLHLDGRMPLGDQMFFFLIFSFVLVLAVRGFLFRKDLPPPGFILVAAGLLCALAGSAILIVGHISTSLLPSPVAALGKLLLYQGYPLLPVMGVGAFLLPRFLGLQGRQGFPESLAPPRGWLPLAGFAAMCGAAVIAGFVLESFGWARAGNALKAVALAVYLFREIPLHSAMRGGGSLALGLRIALVCIPLAFALMAIWPDRTLSFLHVLFISGFSLLVFVVASRVVLGHSGQEEKFGARIWPVVFMTSLVVLAMLTRVSADWLPYIRISHYAYASLAWAAGVAAWAAFVLLPGVRRGDPETRGPR